MIWVGRSALHLGPEVGDFFYDRKPKSDDIRWVFNRRNWRLAFIQMRDVGSRDWVDATPEDASEVKLDLIENDTRFLGELEEWGLLESSNLPSWTTNASRQDEHPPVPWDDLPMPRRSSTAFRSSRRSPTSTGSATIVALRVRRRAADRPARRGSSKTWFKK